MNGGSIWRNDLPVDPESFLPAGLSPEARLLLLVASCGDANAKRDKIDALLAEGLDWSYLFPAARHNRMFPLLYHHLKDRPNDSVPTSVAAELKAQFNKNSLHNLFLAQELIRIHDLLESNHIPAVSYKGVTLAQTLYENLSLRQMWDLDILVHTEDVLKVRSLLVSDGYRPEREMDHDEEQRFLRNDCEYNFDREDGKVHLEVHWKILPDSFSGGYRADHLWDVVQEINVAGRPIPTIQSEELLFLLCVHGGDKHQWWRLKWICDIARLVEKNPSLDWDRVARMSQEAHKQNTLGLGLYLATSLLNAPLSAEIRKRFFKSEYNRAFAGLVMGRLFREDFGLPGFTEWAQYVNAPGFFRGEGSPRSSRLADLLKYLRVVISPEWSDQYALTLPSWLAFAHYFSRPIRLFRKHRQRLLWRLR